MKTQSEAEGTERNHKMHEDFDTRLWADHGRHFSEAMSDVFAQARTAFQVLAALQFTAPWHSEKRHDRNRACTSC